MTERIPIARYIEENLPTKFYLVFPDPKLSFTDESSVNDIYYYAIVDSDNTVRFAKFDRKKGAINDTNLNKYGQFIKIGKILRVLNKDLSDKEVEQLVYSITALSSSRLTHEVKSVKDVYENTFFTSCMTKDEDDIYEVYSMLGIRAIQIYEGESEIGRALLWDNVNITKGDLDVNVPLVDRIYSSTSNYEKIASYLMDNKYFIRRGQYIYCSEDNNLYIRYKNEDGVEIGLENAKLKKEYSDLRSKLERADLKLPYMDTLYYVNDMGIFSYHVPDSIQLRSHEFHTMEQLIEDQEDVTCECCGEDFDRDSMTITHDGSLVCERCIANEYVYTEDRDEYYHIEDAYRCVTNGKYYASTEYLVSVNDEYYLDDDDEVVYAVDKGKYSLIGDTVFCETDGNYYVNTDYLVKVDSVYYLKDDPNIPSVLTEAVN